jgi:hypothetical protein
MRPQKEASLLVGMAALKISPSLHSVAPSTLTYVRQLNGLFASKILYRIAWRLEGNTGTGLEREAQQLEGDVKGSSHGISFRVLIISGVLSKYE